MGHVQLFDGYDEDALQQSGDLATATRIEFFSSMNETIHWGAAYGLAINGSGLIWDTSDDRPVAGVVTEFNILGAYGREVIDDIHVDAATLGLAFGHPAPPALSQAALGVGGDLIEVMGTTLPSTDTTYLARGWGGNDTMLGGGSQSTLWGGDGDDVIQARTGDGNYLRGEAGDDSIVGAAGFDDINGNQGNDTIDGGPGGGDWLVGGQGNDLIYAQHSDNILYGNLGNDTLIGGAGNDVIRGGQGDDSMAGGSGNEFISGDRGNDTMSGGAGADIFHTFSGAGVDKVLDFHLAEGDRVMVDPGTIFTVSQVGADTVIGMGNGDQMILVGVQMATLTPGWIFGA